MDMNQFYSSVTAFPLKLNFHEPDSDTKEYSGNILDEHISKLSDGPRKLANDIEGMLVDTFVKPEIITREFSKEVAEWVNRIEADYDTAEKIAKIKKFDSDSMINFPKASIVMQSGAVEFAQNELHTTGIYQYNNRLWKDPFNATLSRSKENIEFFRKALKLVFKEETWTYEYIHDFAANLKFYNKEAIPKLALMSEARKKDIVFNAVQAVEKCKPWIEENIKILRFINAIRMNDKTAAAVLEYHKCYKVQEMDGLLTLIFAHGLDMIKSEKTTFSELFYLLNVGIIVPHEMTNQATENLTTIPERHIHLTKDVPFIENYNSLPPEDRYPSLKLFREHAFKARSITLLMSGIPNGDAFRKMLGEIKRIMDECAPPYHTPQRNGVNKRMLYDFTFAIHGHDQNIEIFMDSIFAFKCYSVDYHVYHSSALLENKLVGFKYPVVVGYNGNRTAADAMQYIKIFQDETYKDVYTKCISKTMHQCCSGYNDQEDEDKIHRFDAGSFPEDENLNYKSVEEYTSCDRFKVRNVTWKWRSHRKYFEAITALSRNIDFPAGGSTVSHISMSNLEGKFATMLKRLSSKTTKEGLINFFKETKNARTLSSTHGAFVVSTKYGLGYCSGFSVNIAPLIMIQEDVTSDLIENNLTIYQKALERGRELVYGLQASIYSFSLEGTSLTPSMYPVFECTVSGIGKAFFTHMVLNPTEVRENLELRISHFQQLHYGGELDPGVFTQTLDLYYKRAQLFYDYAKAECGKKIFEANVASGMSEEHAKLSVSSHEEMKKLADVFLKMHCLKKYQSKISIPATIGSDFFQNATSYEPFYMPGTFLPTAMWTSQEIVGLKERQYSLSPILVTVNAIANEQGNYNTLVNYISNLANRASKNPDKLVGGNRAVNFLLWLYEEICTTYNTEDLMKEMHQSLDMTMHGFNIKNLIAGKIKDHENDTEAIFDVFNSSHKAGLVCMATATFVERDRKCSFEFCVD